MKILYIHQYFKTPEEGGAIRSWYIANAMIKAGHEVIMVTSTNEPTYIRKNMQGISVHYLPIYYNNSFGFIKRLIAFLKFAHKAYHFSKLITGIDLAYITSTPLTVGLVALTLKNRNKIPFVFEIRDLWPEAPIQIGIIKNPILKYISRSLEKKIYHKASRLVALSPGIKSFIVENFKKKPVLLCPNMADCDFFEPFPGPDIDIMKEYTLQGYFVISYFGALGRVNQLSYLLDLAKIVEKHKLNIKFFIIGDGAMKHTLISETYSREILNVFFIDHLNKYELKKYLSITDAAYISFAKYPVLEHNSPNKFFDALASGKLVITNTGGWIKDLVEENKCGFYYDPDKPENIIELIRPLLSDRALLNKYKQNARNLAESDFDRKKLVQQLLEFIS